MLKEVNSIFISTSRSSKTVKLIISKRRSALKPAKARLPSVTLVMTAPSGQIYSTKMSDQASQSRREMQEGEKQQISRNNTCHVKSHAIQTTKREHQERCMKSCKFISTYLGKCSLHLFRETNSKGQCSFCIVANGSPSMSIDRMQASSSGRAIIQWFMLEKTFQITKSNHYPSTDKSATESCP